MTLSGTNVVPAGIESVKVIFIASTFPVFFTSEI
ncbi:cell surface domain protein [Bacillus cereus]|nr:cell surface domain protein [Bacillus cereus]